MTAEIISSKFSPETLQKLAGMEIPPEAMAMLQAPLDHYRIDVESDSTVRADLESGRREMAEFLTGTAQFFSAMAPIVAQAPTAAGPVVEMYSSFARQFNLGRQAEEALEQFAQIAQEAATQQQANPQAEAAQAEMQARQAEKQADVGLKREEMAQKGQIAQADMQIKARELALKEREIALREAEIAVEGQRVAGENAARQGEMAGNAAELVTVLAAPLQQALAPLIQMVMQSDARQSAESQQMMQAIAAMAAAMSAPKEIVRDVDGRAMGVRTAMMN